MLKKICFLLITGMVLSGCSLVPQKSGLEIVSYPPAKVFLGGKDAGSTPYTNKSLLPGEILVKLVSNSGEWSKKIILKNNINTAVDWEFGKSDIESGGYILSMEKTGDDKKAGLMVSSVPDKVEVAVDNEIKDLAPMKLDSVGEGDRQITLSFPGYKTINVFVRATNGYKLAIEAKLAKESIVIPPEPTVDNQNTISTSQSKRMVKIKDTETGWLRVRETPSNSSMEIRKINPGEKYFVLEEQGDWTRIELNNGIDGWVSTKYVETVLGQG